MTSTIKIEPFSKKKVLLRLEDPTQKSRWDKVLGKIGATWIDSDRDPGWLLSKNDVEIFEEVVDKYGSRNKRRSSRWKHSGKNSEDDDLERKGSRFRRPGAAAAATSKTDSSREHYKSNKDRGYSHSSSDSRYDEEEPSDSDSDDELIQQTLARRLMSESSQKEIEEELIGNSDLEDVVSTCRRMRHIYSVLKFLSSRVKLLEDIIAKISPSDLQKSHP